ncbi:helix-turn-helix domain-containing protein [Vagococcus salmoninarum]|uniref:helix-turn-helix domain-containing protein n=1 Tax=Vagococcus salmoninarum TaxID=2739 RepID=UPI00187F4DD7|nr:helix-turn-helix transcriptional regulator [Vagococcus salmoninarum]MBE9387876.1 helix-turn-helix transcriptional regulator [Vagococcus salmoninarum]
MVNIDKLKGKIRELQTTQECLADEIGINKSTLYRKFKNGGDTFEIWEVQKIVEFLKLSDDEVKHIFFNNQGA